MTYDTGGLGRGAGETSRRTPFLILSRAVGYLIVPLYVAGVCATYLLERGAGLREEAGLIGIIETALLNVGLGAFAVVGALLVVRRSANPIGWIMLSVCLPGGYYATYVMLTRGQPDALAVFGAWIFNCFWFLLLALTFVYLPLLFPDVPFSYSLLRDCMKTPDRSRTGTPPSAENGLRGLYFGVWCNRRPTIGASPTTFHTVSRIRILGSSPRIML